MYIHIQGVGAHSARPHSLILGSNAFACCLGALCKPSDHMTRFNQLAKKLVSSLATCLARAHNRSRLEQNRLLCVAPTGNLAFQIELFRPVQVVKVSIDINLFCAH